jgi:general secretion pathway protein F
MQRWFPSPRRESLRTVTTDGAEHVRTVLKSVHKGVLEGRRFSEAMAISRKAFRRVPRHGRAAKARARSPSSSIASHLLERQAQVRGKVLTANRPTRSCWRGRHRGGARAEIFVVPQVVEQFESVGRNFPFSPAP